jgi:hypothetical protein
LYGGAAGGGKSDALIELPMYWIDHPEFRAIILRRERDDLQELIDRQKLYYEQFVPEMQWNESRRRWEAPWGATIQMGAAEHEDDILAFKSFQYSLILFDELTTWTLKQYLFMFSRNRVKGGTGLPLYIRSATNPGDIGHQWVFDRFIENRVPYRIYNVPVDVAGIGVRNITRQFIPATVFDNPMLENREEYIVGLQQMGGELADAMLWGKWSAFEGQFFTKLPTPTPARIEHPDYYLIRTMDYGFNDPTVVYWLVVYRRIPYVDIIGEMYAAGVTVDDLARMIQRREQEMEIKYRLQRPAISVADPSIKNRKSDGSQSVMDMFSRRGVWFVEANNDRAAGWGMLRMLLHSGRLRVWSDDGVSTVAPWLMKTLPSLRYDPNKRDDIKKGGNDHPADSLRYGVVAYFEGSVPEKKQEVKDPTRQDTVYEDIQKRVGQDSTDPMIEFGGGLL